MLNQMAFLVDVRGGRKANVRLACDGVRSLLRNGAMRRLRAGHRRFDLEHILVGLLIVEHVGDAGRFAVCARRKRTPRQTRQQ